MKLVSSFAKRLKTSLLQDMREEVQNNSSSLEECKTMLKELMVVNKFLSLPPSVIKLVSDAFKCKICLKAPMIPPVIATSCCNVLLGCSICINEWYSGPGAPDKSCTHCREPRGYAQTFQFKGIDDFLKGFKKIMSDPSAGDVACSAGVLLGRVSVTTLRPPC